MFDTLETSASALVAQRTRMDIIAGNLANAYSSASEADTGEPFRRRIVTFAPSSPNGGAGVHVESIERDPAEFRMVHDPAHPHALRDGEWAGYVRYPNVSTTLEYADALMASRAYEANISMMNVTRGMLQRSIELLA